MPNYDNYIHQLHDLVQLLHKLIIEKPGEFKKILIEIDAGRINGQDQVKRGTKSQQSKIKEVSRNSRDISDRIPIEQAKKILDNNFASIGSVEHWSEAMGYSKSYFWRTFEAYFREPPQSVFIEKKKSALVEFYKKHPDCNSREAARWIHLRDGNGLYQFVKRHFHCTPTQLKEKVQNS